MNIPKWKSGLLPDLANSATVNILYMSFGTLIFMDVLPLGTELRELLGHKICICSALTDIASFSKWQVPTYISTRVYKFQMLQYLVLQVLLNVRHFGWCVCHLLVVLFLDKLMSLRSFSYIY